MSDIQTPPTDADAPLEPSVDAEAPTQPDVAQPDVAQPDVAQPDDAQPDVGIEEGLPPAPSPRPVTHTGWGEDSGEEPPDPTPALPHLVIEFFSWLWYASERDGGTFSLGGEDGVFTYWVDDRLSFRLPDEDKARAVLTGESAAATLEARAALSGGKVVRDLRLALRREDREYSVTLRGLHLDLQGAKLPAELKSGAADEILYERMFLLDELWFMVAALYRAFAQERTSPDWRVVHLPAIRRWVSGVDELAGDAGSP